MLQEQRPKNKEKAEKEEADRLYAEEKAQREQERAEMAPYIVGSID